MLDRPFTFTISSRNRMPNSRGNHISRHLSTMRGQFYDQQAYDALLACDDALVYEVYEIQRPEVAGELRHGISVVHPGKVGEEFFMTKGHFHAELETAEVYYCLQGEGMMIIETPEGDYSIEPLHTGKVLYVPPRWAHRSVNTNSKEDLVVFFVYPSNAGHDYGSIETRGLRKLVIERDGQPAIVDNPRWLSPEER